MYMRAGQRPNEKKNPKCQWKFEWPFSRVFQCQKDLSCKLVKNGQNRFFVLKNFLPRHFSEFSRFLSTAEHFHLLKVSLIFITLQCCRSFRHLRPVPCYNYWNIHYPLEIVMTKNRFWMLLASSQREILIRHWDTLKNLH